MVPITLQVTLLECTSKLAQVQLSLLELHKWTTVNSLIIPMPDGKIENSSSVSPTPALLQIFTQFCFVLSNVSQTLNKFVAPTHIQLGEEISISFFCWRSGYLQGLLLAWTHGFFSVPGSRCWGSQIYDWFCKASYLFLDPSWDLYLS